MSNHIYIFLFRSKQTATHLFSSEDEAEQQSLPQKSRGSSPTSTNRREKRAMGGESSQAKPKKKKKTIINPINSCRRPTSHELFGTDSDEPEEEPAGIASGKKIPPLNSYFTRRIANGISRQSDDRKTGKYYVELKIYNVEEIERVSPINRWRHAILTVKNRTDDRTPAWDRLKEFVGETRKEFKHCPLDFVSHYY